MKKTNPFGSILLSVLALIFAACGDSEDTGTSSRLTGHFTYGPVEGLSYTCGDVSGTTDIDGTFTYYDGETVTFYIGDMFMGSGTAKARITPEDLVVQEANDSDDTKTKKVLHLCSLLMALDSDQNPTNGISLNTDTTDLFGREQSYYASDLCLPFAWKGKAFRLFYDSPVDTSQACEAVDDDESLIRIELNNKIVEAESVDKDAVSFLDLDVTSFHTDPSLVNLFLNAFAVDDADRFFLCTYEDNPDASGDSPASYDVITEDTWVVSMSADDSDLTRDFSDEASVLNGFSITIPEGVLVEEGTVTLGYIEDITALPSGVVASFPVIVIESSPSAEMFNDGDDLQLSMPWNAEDYPSVHRINADTLNLYQFDDSENEWKIASERSLTAIGSNRVTFSFIPGDTTFLAVGLAYSYGPTPCYYTADDEALGAVDGSYTALWSFPESYWKYQRKQAETLLAMALSTPYTGVYSGTYKSHDYEGNLELIIRINAFGTCIIQNVYGTTFNGVYAEVVGNSVDNKTGIATFTLTYSGISLTFEGIVEPDSGKLTGSLYNDNDEPLGAFTCQKYMEK